MFILRMTFESLNIFSKTFTLEKSCTFVAICRKFKKQMDRKLVVMDNAKTPTDKRKPFRD